MTKNDALMQPVAWFCKSPDNKISIKIVGKPTEGNWEPLYTAPPQREWVRLTEEDIADCLEMSIQGTCRAIEAKLKEKNNG